MQRSGWLRQTSQGEIPANDASAYFSNAYQSAGMPYASYQASYPYQGAFQPYYHPNASAMPGMPPGWPTGPPNASTPVPTTPVPSAPASEPTPAVLDLTMEEESGDGELCRLCSVLGLPGGRRYSRPQHKAAHAAKHRSEALPDPLSQCFPIPEPPPPPPSISPEPMETPPPPPQHSSSHQESMSREELEEQERSGEESRAGQDLNQTSTSDSATSANILALFAGRLGLTGCYYPDCGSQVKANLLTHVQSHSNRALVQCGHCGFRAKVQIYEHHRKHHPGLKMQCVEFWKSDPGLVEYLTSLVYASYPQLRDSAVALDTRRRCPRLAAALHQLAKSGGQSLRCRYSGCEAVVVSTTLALEVHALGHWSGRPVFECNSCRFAGPDILAHCLGVHKAAVGIGGAYNFTDHRDKEEDGLLSNLAICFPSGRPSLSPPPPPASLNLSSSSAFSHHPMPSSTGHGKPMPPPLRCSTRASVRPDESFAVDQSFNQSSLNGSRVEKTPLPKRLLAYNIVFRLGWKTGLYKLDKCRFPGRQYNPLDHLTKHVKRPTEECGVCGFRKRGAVDTHFRQRHPEIAKIQAIDIRYLIEEEMLRVMKQSYPGLDSALLFARVTLPDGTPIPKRWLHALESLTGMGGLECAWLDCENAELGNTSSLALETHVLEHQSTPAFRCLSCRYEGQDMLGHGTTAHVRRGPAASAFKYEDARPAMEDDLLRLLHQCFPQAHIDRVEEEEEPEKLDLTRLEESDRQSSCRGTRAEVGSTSKPWRYLWLMRMLFGYRSVTGQELACQLCGLVTQKGARPDSHAYGHVKTFLYICKVCGYKTKHKAAGGSMNHGRGDPEHERLGKNLMEDVRWEKDAELVVAAIQCFPVLAQLRLWFEGPETSFVRSVESLCAERWELRCALGDCSFSLSNAQTEILSEVEAQRHVLSHFDSSVFSCHQCRYTGQEIWAHIQEAHSSFSRRANAGLPFDDRRAQYDPHLTSLLNIVFP